MATYKDDLDILTAAFKDSNKLSLNAITELDNKGLLGMYGGGGESDLVKTGTVTIINDSSQDNIEISFIKCAATSQELSYIVDDRALFSAGVLQREFDFVYPSIFRITSDSLNLIFDESKKYSIVVREDNMVLHIVDGHGGK